MENKHGVDPNREQGILDAQGDYNYDGHINQIVSRIRHITVRAKEGDDMQRFLARANNGLPPLSGFQAECVQSELRKIFGSQEFVTINGIKLVLT